MAKVTFASSEMQNLSRSKGIEKITSKSITYNKEFKVAVATCKNIIKVKETFIEWGIDTWIGTILPDNFYKGLSC